jgi:hypothetical protein
LGALRAISRTARAICSPPYDRAELGADEAAAVTDRGGVRVEQADEGVDVLGFPCLLEVPDDIGVLGCRSRGSLRRSNDR